MHKTIRLPVPEAARAHIEWLQIVHPLMRDVRPVRAARIAILSSRVESPPRPKVIAIQAVAATRECVVGMQAVAARRDGVDHVERIWSVVPWRDCVISMRYVAAPSEHVESINPQPSRVVRVRSVTIQTPDVRVASIRYQTPPATPFGYPDRPLRRDTEEEMRARMPGAALIWDDVVRTFGVPKRIQLAEAGHAVKWTAEARR